MGLGMATSIKMTESLGKETMSNEVKIVKVRPQREKDEYSAVTTKQGNRASASNAVLKKPVAFGALRRGGYKNATGQFLVFLVKVVALEAVRRGSQEKCRPIWWGLQGLSVFQAPPFSWLQRWAPFRVLAHATESFSKPMICLSLATAVASVCKEVRQEKPVVVTDVVTDTNLAADLSITDIRTGEAKEEEIVVNDQQALSVEVLKQELERNGVILPERMDDDEVERFGSTADGDMSKFVANMKKTVQWRETYHFLSQPDLKMWTHLVFWHLQDIQGRPTLIIRLGLAYSTLAPSDRPRFAQAVVSQVEYGLQNKVIKDDARITVVMDCQGTTALGFPVQMMKSCAVLVQENYPTRLADLFVINLPAIVRVLAIAIMQVVKPSTREKVHMEGEKHMNNLAPHLGGIFNVPAALGGKCRCELCKEIQAHKVNPDMSLVAHRARSEYEQLEDPDLALEERAYSQRLATYESYTPTLRVVILGLVLLWIVVAMVSGSYETHPPPT